MEFSWKLVLFFGVKKCKTHWKHDLCSNEVKYLKCANDTKYMFFYWSLILFSLNQNVNGFKCNLMGLFYIRKIVYIYIEVSKLIIYAFNKNFVCHTKDWIRITYFLYKIITNFASWEEAINFVYLWSYPTYCTRADKNNHSMCKLTHFVYI